jgi:hypothetical protein
MTNSIMTFLSLPVRQALVPCALITLATAAGVVVARRPGYLVSKTCLDLHIQHSGCLNVHILSSIGKICFT